jgi:hypothetical protein
MLLGLDWDATLYARECERSRALRAASDEQMLSCVWARMRVEI